MALGRPSIYDQSYAERLIAYFKGKPFYEENEEGQRRAAEFITFEGFCNSVGIWKETLYEWARDERKPDFVDAYRLASNWQEQYLITNGLAGRTKENFTKFLLSAKHGYVEKNATDLKHEGGVNVTIQGF